MGGTYTTRFGRQDGGVIDSSARERFEDGAGSGSRISAHDAARILRSGSIGARLH